MAKISFLEATRLYKVSRSKLYRDASQGILTTQVENGVKTADTAELGRVYNPRKKNETISETTRESHRNEANDRAAIHLIAAHNEIKSLKRESQILHGQIELLRDQINKKDEMLTMLTRLLPKPKP